jgi:hypothetical protein
VVVVVTAPKLEGPGTVVVELDVGTVVLDEELVVVDDGRPEVGGEGPLGPEGQTSGAVVEVVLDVATVVLDVRTVVLDVGTVVLDVGTVVLDVATLVLDVGTVVLDVATVVLDDEVPAPSPAVTLGKYSW